MLELVYTIDEPGRMDIDYPHALGVEVKDSNGNIILSGSLVPFMGGHQVYFVPGLAYPVRFMAWEVPDGS